MAQVFLSSFFGFWKAIKIKKVKKRQKKKGTNAAETTVFLLPSHFTFSSQTKKKIKVWWKYSKSQNKRPKKGKSVCCFPDVTPWASTVAMVKDYLLSWSVCNAEDTCKPVFRGHQGFNKSSWLCTLLWRKEKGFKPWGHWILFKPWGSKSGSTVLGSNVRGGTPDNAIITESSTHWTSHDQSIISQSVHDLSFKHFLLVL